MTQNAQNKRKKWLTVSGQSKQASKQSIHTHRHNEVTLVWGLLRLAPITHRFSLAFHTTIHICLHPVTSQHTHTSTHTHTHTPPLTPICKKNKIAAQLRRLWASTSMMTNNRLHIRNTMKNIGMNRSFSSTLCTAVVILFVSDMFSLFFTWRVCADGYVWRCVRGVNCARIYYVCVCMYACVVCVCVCVLCVCGVCVCVWCVVCVCVVCVVWCVCVCVVCGVCVCICTRIYNSCELLLCIYINCTSTKCRCAITRGEGDHVMQCN